MPGRSRSKAALAVVGSLVVAGGLGLAAPASAAQTTGAPTTARSVTIGVHRTSVGKRVSAAGGRTVYLFSIDRSTRSNCGKTCRTVWKPVTSERSPKAGAGIRRSALGRIAHDQVTYRGHPLYYYLGDHRAGQASGEGLLAFKGFWYTLTSKGKRG